ncbi:PepSY domain-containing protein [Streptomyces sioyaensis]|uniref:PepSY domain-containing protein n=1 Tax=Streptomyces sioyaensis TaxID=67364 RepID=UPI00378E8EBF
MVTRDYAQKAALATDPDARVSGVHLGHKVGRRVWQVLLTEDGSVRDVDVDAGSGAILQAEGRLRDAH